MGAGKGEDAGRHVRPAQRQSARGGLPRPLTGQRQRAGVGTVNLAEVKRDRAARTCGGQKTLTRSKLGGGVRQRQFARQGQDGVGHFAAAPVASGLNS